MAFLLFLQRAARYDGRKHYAQGCEVCTRSSGRLTSSLVSSRAATRPRSALLAMKTKRHNLDEMGSVRDSAHEARKELRRGDALGAGTGSVSMRERTSEAAESRAEQTQRGDGIPSKLVGTHEAAGASARTNAKAEEASAERLPDLTLTEIQEFFEVLSKVTIHCSDVQLRVGNTVIEVSRPDGRGFDESGQLREAFPKSAEALDGGASMVVERRAAVPAAPGTSASAVPPSKGRRSDASTPPSMSSQSGTVTGRPSMSTTEQRPRYDDVSQVLDTDFKVVSNRVGFFHAGPPSRPPYVKAGDRVEVKRPVCIIEQLGNYFVYNAEVSGTVIKVCVEDGAPVEYGQELVIIRPE